MFPKILTQNNVSCGFGVCKDKDMYRNVCGDDSKKPRDYTEVQKCTTSKTPKSRDYTDVHSIRKEKLIQKPTGSEMRILQNYEL